MAEDYGQWPWSTDRAYPWIPFCSQSALGMIASGGLLIYLAYEFSP